MQPEVAVGFDVGTTSVKAGLLQLGRNASRRGMAPMTVVRRPYPTERPRPGWSQQDPEEWVRAMAACWMELVGRVGSFVVRSVGICSQVNTHVLVDRSLAPVHPAITWQDVRASAEAAELDRRVEGRRTELWGGPFTVDASFALARVAWLTRHEPSRVGAARWLLSPKDYCVAALTGEVVTDPISPVGVVGADGRYIDGVIDLVPSSRMLLPPLRSFDAPAGVVRTSNPVGLRAGAPVAVGTMDAWGNVYGSGVVRSGRAMEVAGTSEILAVLSDRAIPTRGVISFAPVRGRHLHAGPTQSGGDALDWAARCFRVPVDEILALAAAGRRDPEPIVFLPHLAGERAPVWNPDARGVFVGVTTQTELRHLALAVLEGVAFSARRALEACEEAAGVRATEVRLSGGGARSDLWNHVKASVHRRTLGAMATLDSGVLGAALMGLVAAGIEPELEEAADRLASVGRMFDPEPGESGRLESLYGTYREAYDALVPVFSSIARL